MEYSMLQNLKGKQRGNEIIRYVQQKGWILIRVAVIVDRVIEYARMNNLEGNIRERSYKCQSF